MHAPPQEGSRGIVLRDALDPEHGLSFRRTLRLLRCGRRACSQGFLQNGVRTPPGERKPLRIGMRGALKDLAAALFDDSARHEDHEAVRKARREAEVVRDEHERRARRPPHLLKAREDGPDVDDVKRARGFVGENHVGPEDEDAGGHDALEHPARKLAREGPEDAGGIEPDRTKRSAHGLIGLRARKSCGRSGFAELHADPHEGVKGGHRLLGHVEDAPAAHCGEGARCAERPALEVHRPRDREAVRKKPRKRPQGQGLPCARLAHERKALAPAHVEVEPVQDFPVPGITDAKARDTENHVVCVRHSVLLTSKASRSASPRKLSAATTSRIARPGTNICPG